MARVLTCYYRPKPGGLCKRLCRAMNALLKQGHEVHYLAVVPFSVTHPDCHYHRFPWPVGHTQGLLFWAVFHLLAPLMLLLIGVRYRITHAFAFGTNYAFLMQPVRLVKRVPLTLFLRADALLNHRIKGSSKWLLKLEQWIEGLAIAGVCLCGVSKLLVAQVMARHSVLMPRHAGVLRNDLEPEPAVGTRRAAVGPLRASGVGIIEPRKNQELIIRCMAQFQADQIHLSLYGVGPQEGELRGLVNQLGVADRVSFRGWVNTAELWQNTDLLLFPSRHEGAPNAVLEALARQIPVLASDIPEHREMLPEATLLSIDTLEPWVTALRHILASPEVQLRALSASQSEAASRLCFDWDTEICTRILQGC